MPRKTRQQKIRSEKRQASLISESTFTYSLSPSTTPKVAQWASSNTSEFSLIRHDIIKTLVIGSLFIAFEFLLSLFSKNLGW